MVIVRAVATHSAGLLQCSRYGLCLHPYKIFSIVTKVRRHSLHNAQSYYLPCKRTFSTSRRQCNTGQEAPSAQAYIKSGVLAGKKDLVDVKKVLVIGSGGLSIGQAGEFDYSGT